VFLIYCPKRIQLYMYFPAHTYMFRSPSATIFSVCSINIRSTIDVVCGDILQDLVHFKMV
jgi:hypothetical protein